MSLELYTRQSEQVVLVEAVGKLTLTDGRTKLRDLLHVFTNNGSKKFVLNLAQIEAIDSYGVGELARCYSVVRQMSGEIKLANVSQRVLGVLETCRLNQLFGIYVNDAAALEAFGRRI